MGNVHVAAAWYLLSPQVSLRNREMLGLPDKPSRKEVCPSPCVFLTAGLSSFLYIPQSPARHPQGAATPEPSSPRMPP